MAWWAMYWKQAARHLAVALLVGGVGVFGCSKAPPAAQTASDDSRDADTESSENHGKSESKGNAKSTESAEDALHQPFEKAVRQLNDPPADSTLPPAKTISGKSVYRIVQDVAAQWDGIRFTTAEGKRLHYSATIYTALGEIDIDLRPDLAPNHVRNFVALARAGYYEQLFFECAYREEDFASKRMSLEHVEAGCPRGTGEDPSGSIGYWLLPEMHPTEKATHTVGTVGACRGMEKDSAGCRFYITLTDTPQLDNTWTIFGKVTRGLDAVRRIFEQPVIPEDRSHFGLLHPMRPVMIQKVVIHTRVGEAEGTK
jgi:peptidyl-prolyl cis-trans isomerase B (cyclophilin B)